MKLTKRQLELLNLLKEGLTNEEVGARLGISEDTVKNELTMVYLKLGVRNRVEAVIKAIVDGHVYLDIPGQQPSPEPFPAGQKFSSGNIDT